MEQMPYLLPDEELLAQCRYYPYQASGPGGQKRNRTRAAVRLVHEPSGISVVAAESRSQAENRRRALRRLRETLALELRDPATFQQRLAMPNIQQALATHGSLRLRDSNPLYPALAALVLDALQIAEGRVGQAARLLGTNSSRITAFLRRHPRLWHHANELRRRFRLPPLR